MRCFFRMLCWTFLPTYRLVCDLSHTVFLIHQEVRYLVKVAEELQAQIAALNTATNDVADLIQRLAGGIKNSMSDEELATVKAGFTAVTERLRGLAQDPANPTPAPVAVFSALQSGKSLTTDKGTGKLKVK